MIQVQLIGVENLKEKIRIKPSQAKAQLKVAIGISCLKIMSEIRTAISTIGEPDDFPRRVTGNLLNSVRVGNLKDEGKQVSQTVGANPDGTEIGYANFLEFGTSRMKPRPFVTFITEKDKDYIMKQLQDAVRKVC